MEDTTAPVQERLDSLLAAGRQMLAVARDGDWGRAVELQAGCRDLAESLLKGPVDDGDVDTIAAALREARSLHDQTLDLCRASREACMQQIEGFNQGRQAVSAYTANSD